MLRIDDDYKIKKFADIEFTINDLRGEIEIIRKFVNSEKFVLLITSPPGTGKTLVLHCLLYEYICKGYKMYYLTAPLLRELLLDHTRNCYGRNYEGDLRDFMTAKIKIIDELGLEGESDTGHFERYLCQILDDQFTGGKIICASNFSKQQLINRYKDKRTEDRLNQAICLSWGGKSYRSLKNRR
jgi:DNA replication protein DnaC